MKKVPGKTSEVKLHLVMHWLYQHDGVGKKNWGIVQYPNGSFKLILYNCREQIVTAITCNGDEIEVQFEP